MQAWGTKTPQEKMSPLGTNMHAYQHSHSNADASSSRGESENSKHAMQNGAKGPAQGEACWPHFHGPPPKPAPDLSLPLPQNPPLSSASLSLWMNCWGGEFKFSPQLTALAPRWLSSKKRGLDIFLGRLIFVHLPATNS